MGFSHRVAFATAAALALALGGVLALSVHNGREALRQQTHDVLANVSLVTRTLFTRAAGVVIGQAEMLARQPETRAAVAARDRAGLAARFGEGFGYLKAEAGVEILAVQTADLKQLYQAHDPSQFGEDATSRPILVSTNRSRRGQRGIEMGLAGLAAVHGTAPVMQGDTLVGTLDVGMPLTSMLYAVKNTTGAEIAAVLSTSITGPLPGDRRRYGDLVVSEATDGRVFDSVLETVRPNLVKDDVMTQVEVGDDTYGVLITPLLDFSGRSIGVVVGAKRLTPLFAALHQRVLVSLAVSACGLIVCFSVVLVALRGLVVRPLAALAAHVERVADGVDVPAEVPRGGIAEVERLAAAAARIVAPPLPAGERVVVTELAA
jgi:hypothetical protein